MNLDKNRWFVSHDEGIRLTDNGKRLIQSINSDQDLKILNNELTEDEFFNVAININDSIRDLADALLAYEYQYYDVRLRKALMDNEVKTIGQLFIWINKRRILKLAKYD